MEKQYLNRHHILHNRAYHEANKDNKILRNSMGLIALIDVDAHRQLHRECPAVPPLDMFTAQRVRVLYKPTPNPLIGMERYMFAVEQAMKSPKTNHIERTVAAMAIHAVDLQRPLVAEGLSGIEYRDHGLAV